MKQICIAFHKMQKIQHECMLNTLLYTVIPCTAFKNSKINVESARTIICTGQKPTVTYHRSFNIIFIFVLFIFSSRESLIDKRIESAVSQMQSVIELGRVIRERKTLPIKVSQCLRWCWEIIRNSVARN